MLFLHKKHLTQRNLYTQTAHRGFCRSIFLHAKTLPRTVFTQHFFFAQKPLRTKKKMHSCFCRQTVFTQKVLRTEVLRTEGFTHNIFLRTDAFTHRCLYTDRNCTQKLVHTARVYTQPVFTQRGFVSPSCSCSASFAVCRPTCSMYGIFTNIYPINHPNVGKYTIHGAFGR